MDMDTTVDRLVQELSAGFGALQDEYNQYIRKLEEEYSVREKQWIARHDQATAHFHQMLDDAHRTSEGTVAELRDSRRELAYVRMTIGEYVEMLMVLELERDAATFKIADPSLSIEDFLVLSDQANDRMGLLNQTLSQRQNALRAYYHSLQEGQLNRTALLISQSNR